MDGDLGKGVSCGDADADVLGGAAHRAFADEVDILRDANGGDDVRLAWAHGGNGDGLVATHRPPYEQNRSSKQSL